MRLQPSALTVVGIDDDEEQLFVWAQAPSVNTPAISSPAFLVLPISALWEASKAWPRLSNADPDGRLLSAKWPFIC